MAAAFGAQSLVSAYFKSTRRVAVAAIYDGGLYACILAGALGPWGSAGLAPYVLLVSTYLLILFAQSLGGNGGSRGGFVEALSYSVPLMIPSFAMLCLVNSGRMFAGSVLPAADMGVLGILFRITAPAIVVHQVLTTYYFPQIYGQKDAGTLDRYFSAVVGAVAGVALLALLFVPSLAMSRIPSLSAIESHPGFAGLYYLMTIQVVLWVLLALLEALMARESLVRAQTGILAGSILFFVVCSGVLFEISDRKLFWIVAAQTGAFALASFLMVRRLGDRGLCLPWTGRGIWMLTALLGLGVLFA